MRFSCLSYTRLFPITSHTIQTTRYRLLYYGQKPKTPVLELNAKYQKHRQTVSRAYINLVLNTLLKILGRLDKIKEEHPSIGALGGSAEIG